MEIMKHIDNDLVHPLIGTAAANLAVIDIHRMDLIEAYDMLSTAREQFEKIQVGLQEQSTTLQLQREFFGFHFYREKITKFRRTQLDIHFYLTHTFTCKVKRVDFVSNADSMDHSKVFISG